MIDQNPDFDPLKSGTLSALVRHLEDSIPQDEELSFAQFLQLLGVHGFIFLVLLLALLNLVIFMLPGLSILFGIPMVILAVQMLQGLPAPIFPEYVLNWKIRRDAVQKGIVLAAQALDRIERWVKPRFLVLTSPILRKLHYLLALVLALMVSIPVPFINLPPTFGIVLLAIGLMQRDGVFIVGAYLFGIWSFRLYESLGVAAQALVG